MRNNNDFFKQVAEQQCKRVALKGQTIKYNNIFPLKDFSNTNTDTKTYFYMALYDFNNGYSLTGDSIDSSGRKTYIFTANYTSNNVYFYHSGSTTNIYVNGTISVVANHKYALIFDLNGYNTTIVGGLLINNIMIIDLTECNIDVSSVSDFNNTNLGKWIKNVQYINYTNGENIVINADSADLNFYGKNLLNLSRTLGTLSGFNANRDFNESNYYVGISRANYYSSANATLNYLDSEKINLTSNSGGYGVGFPVALKPNTTYTITCYDNNTSSYGGIGLGFYDANGVLISFTDNETLNSKKIKTFVVPYNCVMVNIVFYGLTNTTHEFYNIQLEENSTDTTYEKYIKPLNFNGSFILSVINDVYDTWKNTSGKLTKRIGVVDLGSLNWQYSGSVFYSNDITNEKDKSGGDKAINGICAKYKIVAFNFISNNKELAINEGEIQIIDNSYTNASEFKQSLSGIRLYYELDTPVETNENSLLIDHRYMKCEDENGIVVEMQDLK